MSSLGFNHIDQANSNEDLYRLKKELYDGSHLWIDLPSQLSSVADSNRQALRVAYFHLRLCHIEVAYFHKSCLFSRELPIFTRVAYFHLRLCHIFAFSCDQYVIIITCLA